MKEHKTIQSIRRLLLFFMMVLFLSRGSAIPIETEASLHLKTFPSSTQLHYWLQKILSAYKNVNHEAPFLLYSYDWLAFAHFTTALLFVGPYRDPVKNIGVIEFGLIACVLIFPLAFIAGSFRGIPIGWRLIDCSFGVFGFLPLWICYSKTRKLICENHSIK